MEEDARHAQPDAETPMQSQDALDQAKDAGDAIEDDLDAMDAGQAENEQLERNTAPKRPLSPFIFYSQDARRDIKK